MSTCRPLSVSAPAFPSAPAAAVRSPGTAPPDDRAATARQLGGQAVVRCHPERPYARAHGWVSLVCPVGVPVRAEPVRLTAHLNVRKEHTGMTPHHFSLGVASMAAVATLGLAGTGSAYAAPTAGTADGNGMASAWSQTSGNQRAAGCDQAATQLKQLTSLVPVANDAIQQVRTACGVANKADTPQSSQSGSVNPLDAAQQGNTGQSADATNQTPGAQPSETAKAPAANGSSNAAPQESQAANPKTTKTKKLSPAECQKFVRQLSQNVGNLTGGSTGGQGILGKLPLQPQSQSSGTGELTKLDGLVKQLRNGATNTGTDRAADANTAAQGNANDKGNTEGNNWNCQVQSNTP